MNTSSDSGLNAAQLHRHRAARHLARDRRVGFPVRQRAQRLRLRLDVQPPVARRRLDGARAEDARDGRSRGPRGTGDPFLGRADVVGGVRPRRRRFRRAQACARSAAERVGVAVVYGPIIWLVMSLVVIPVGDG